MFFFKKQKKDEQSLDSEKSRESEKLKHFIQEMDKTLLEGDPNYALAWTLLQSLSSQEQVVAREYVVKDMTVRLKKYAVDPSAKKIAEMIDTILI